jgi:predicted hotdog family 3-hydroxylacyl-ACP dehydratase
MGFLVSLRAVTLHVPRLDDAGERLTVQVHSDADNGDHGSYAFTLSASGRVLLQGRAVVVLDAAVFSFHHDVRTELRWTTPKPDTAGLSIT